MIDMIVDVVLAILSFAICVAIYWSRSERQKAADRMYVAGREAEDKGDHRLADRLYEAGRRMDL